MLAGLATDRPRSFEELIASDLAEKLDRLDLLSRKMLAGKLPGERRSKRRGRSVEFDDFRTYVPGDDLRHIDWNVLARLDRLFIKLFREEEDLALHLIIDCSGSMDVGRPSKLVFAHRLAMALGYIGLVNQNRVTAALFGRDARVRRLAPIRGRTNLRRLSSLLIESLAAAPVEAGATVQDFNAAMRTIARSRGGRGVVVVMSDFLVEGEYAGGLNALTAGEGGGFDTYCLQILSPGEIDPAKEAGAGLIGDLRLTDVETGRAAEVTLSPALLARYRATVEAYITKLRAACMARGLAHFLVPSDSAIDVLVLNSLRRGGMLR